MLLLPVARPQYLAGAALWCVSAVGNGKQDEVARVTYPPPRPPCAGLLVGLDLYQRQSGRATARQMWEVRRYRRHYPACPAH